MIYRQCINVIIEHLLNQLARGLAILTSVGISLLALQPQMHASNSNSLLPRGYTGRDGRWRWWRRSGSRSRQSLALRYCIKWMCKEQNKQITPDTQCYLSVRRQGRFTKGEDIQSPEGDNLNTHPSGIPRDRTQGPGRPSATRRALGPGPMWTPGPRRPQR